ncbi:signal peptidase I [Gemmatimonas sp.]|uniref:signal peptidase I n=1 Tax=Gemmatimonas sp. TaxID=1962908 RepID=UPI00286D35A1|nr:signal peptidase I [Gemmatimonas sp.]
MAPNKDHRANALRAANGRSRRRAVSFGWVWEWAKVLPPAVLLFLVLRTFVVEAYKIPSGSMERTLLVGDFLLVNKWLYGAEVPYTRRRLPAVRAPQLGDILVFEWPGDPTKNFVKRLVGRPGDTLSMQGGSLLRNGVPVREQYVSHTEPDVDPMTDEFRWQRGYLTNTAAAAEPGMPAIYRPSRDNWGPIVVPPNHLFVLGDNRDNSLDSRYWGFVPDSLLRGTPWIVYYSFTPDSTARAPWLTRIRWGRLGALVR